MLEDPAPEMTPDRRVTSRAMSDSQPNFLDMLWEILLRLPPQPSSLTRVSAVCKHWLRVATEPLFLHDFSAHHRKPPLLGYFDDNMVFRSTLGHPDCIPPQRFDLQHQVTEIETCQIELIGCRHGRVLLIETLANEVIVCNPISRKHQYVHLPSELRCLDVDVAVLCAPADQGHVHGSCHSSPFKLVLMTFCSDNEGPIVYVYSSKTGLWGNPISTTARCELHGTNPGVLVGNAFYWSSKSASPDISNINLDGLTDDIIEFDLSRQSLAVIKGPPCLDGSLMHQITKAENGTLCLAVLSHGTIQIWERNVNCTLGATWLLEKTIEIRSFFELPLQNNGPMRSMEIVGYDEDNDVLFLHVDSNVYMVQLTSMQCSKLDERPKKCHPFTSFYAPETGVHQANPSNSITYPSPDNHKTG